jgi:hypothetical protein
MLSASRRLSSFNACKTLRPCNGDHSATVTRSRGFGKVRVPAEFCFKTHPRGTGRRIGAALGVSRPLACPAAPSPSKPLPDESTPTAAATAAPAGVRDGPAVRELAASPDARHRPSHALLCARRRVAGLRFLKRRWRRRRRDVGAGVRGHRRWRQRHLPVPVQMLQK